STPPAAAYRVVSLAPARTPLQLKMTSSSVSCRCSPGVAVLRRSWVIRLMKSSPGRLRRSETNSLKYRKMSPCAPAPDSSLSPSHGSVGISPIHSPGGPGQVHPRPPPVVGYPRGDVEEVQCAGVAGGGDRLGDDPPRGPLDARQLGMAERLGDDPLELGVVGRVGDDEHPLRHSRHRVG